MATVAPRTATVTEVLERSNRRILARDSGRPRKEN